MPRSSTLPKEINGAPRLSSSSEEKTKDDGVPVRWKIRKPITLANGAKYRGELLGGLKDGYGI